MGCFRSGTAEKEDREVPRYFTTIQMCYGRFCLPMTPRLSNARANKHA